MKVILATGLPDLEDLIEKNIQADFLGAALYRESVAEIVENKEPDVVILSELLEGVTDMKSLVLKLRTRSPKTRIVYIMKDESPTMKSFLYQWMVFDVFAGSFSIPELNDALYNPKEFKDISAEIEVLKKYSRNPDMLEDNEEDAILDQFNSSAYSRLGSQSGDGELYRQIVSFWSTQDLSGKTFSITNTALSLANRSDLKILLLDFNIENPTVNLYYSFVDADKNLGAFVDDLLLEEEITAENFEDYLITHPLYSNLKILPGYILKMARQSDEFMINVFNMILEFSNIHNFSTVLIDTKAGLNPLNKEILSKSSKILLHINENPSSLNSVYRFFDTQYGPFVSSLLDKSKIVPIINQYHPETIVNFKRAIHSFLELPVGASFPQSEKVRLSIQKQTPILSKKTNDETYLGFIRISNTIHPNSFVEPNIKTISSSDKNKEVGSSNTPASSVTSKMKNLFGSKKK